MNVHKDNSPKAKNELGRIQNADESPFRFVSQTVLRRENDVADKTRGMSELLVEALTKGPNGGGIGPFEVMIVSWVQQLRYVTKAMLLDLIRGGYISKGWRDKITADKVNTVINRLNRYNLIELTHFVSVDENGVRINDKQSNARILTLGKQGNIMLHEMNNSMSRYHPFDIFQDGNTVKRYLAANQWLIYWLVHFPDEIGDRYNSAKVVYQRGSNLQGARLYATVTCNNCTMAAEPLRRVEEFELKSERNWMRDKLKRFLEMFSHPDELYLGYDELVFPERPVIVYVCEDEEHIREVHDMISDISEAYPEQEIWYTSDQRIFNYNRIGQRFLKMEGKEMKVVDLKERIGVEELPRRFDTK